MTNFAIASQNNIYTDESDLIMATMNISLPDEMKSWVEAQTDAGGRYGNASDLMRDLIRKEQDRLEALKELQAMVDDALASGISDQTFDAIVADATAEADRRGLA